MLELHLPWLEAMIVAPIVGSVVIRFTRNRESAWRRAVMFAGVTLAMSIGAFVDFSALHIPEAHDHYDVVSRVLHRNVFFIDELSAPLLPLTALLFLLVILATMRTKIRRFSFSWALCSEAILLATFSCHQEWGIVALLIVGAIPPLLELRRRGKPLRVFAFHMGAFSLLLIAGQWLVHSATPHGSYSTLGILLLTAACLLRSGVIPAHCWITDLFEHASFGTSLLYVTPLAGAFAVMRLVLPIAPAWVLATITIASLVTAVYAAGMALVQHDTRRFFCYLFLSHSSLVLIGIELTTPIGMTGALCAWIAVGLSLTGLGLVLRSIEARTGRLSLHKYHGLYDHIPALAGLFLLTGLASIGFPGTLGFVGAELLVEGAVRVSPTISALVVVAAALNGLAIMHAFFRVFTGTHHITSIDISIRPREQIAVLTLAVLILGGGFYPQPGVESRYHAAVQLSQLRTKRGLNEGQSTDVASDAAITEHIAGNDIDAAQSVERHVARPIPAVSNPPVKTTHGFTE